MTQRRRPPAARGGQGAGAGGGGGRATPKGAGSGRAGGSGSRAGQGQFGRTGGRVPSTGSGSGSRGRAGGAASRGQAAGGAGRGGAPAHRSRSTDGGYPGSGDPGERGQVHSRNASGTDLGGEQVEGRRAVRELLRAGRRRVTELWLAEGRDDAPVLAEIEALATNAAVPVRRVGLGRLAAAARTSAPQGVIAFAAPLPELDLDDVVMSGERGLPFLIVLDGVTDPHNVGAVMRAAECAGATGVVLGRHRSAHVNATVAKVAAGAVEHLPIALVAGIPSALSELNRLGVWRVGLAADGDTNLFGMQLASSPVALVLGAEGQGLSRLTRARCDVIARIPLGGQVESLNVATAAAVACFEVLRQRSGTG